MALTPPLPVTAIDSLEVYWRHVLSMLEVVTIVRPIAQTHSIIVRSQECFFCGEAA